MSKTKLVKIWVDDERPVPEGEGYNYHFETVWGALIGIGYLMGGLAGAPGSLDILLDIDHDSGHGGGGDFINILKALSSSECSESLFSGRHIKVHFHSANPVGVKNMRAVVENCEWMEEVKDEDLD